MKRKERKEASLTCLKTERNQGLDRFLGWNAFRDELQRRKQKGEEQKKIKVSLVKSYYQNMVHQHHSHHLQISALLDTLRLKLESNMYDVNNCMYYSTIEI